MPCRRGHGFAVSDMLDACLTIGKEQKMCQTSAYTPLLAG